jgi:hypothetical protein
MTDGKGDAMPWSRVVIVDEPNPEAVQVVRDDLLDRFRALYNAAGAPADAVVYYRQLVEDHIYYFSPTASALAPELLQDFHATPFLEPSHIEEFDKLDFTADA